MAKIGIFYGTTTGYTADVATRIAQALGVQLADVYDVAKAAPSQVGDYDVIILGASTHGDGDVQDDMVDFLDGVSALYLAGKKIALFGCGDENMKYFCSAVGHMYNRLQPTGAQFIGAYNADGYSYDECPAIVDGVCRGLVLDEVNHPDLSDGRIADWASQLKQEA